MKRYLITISVILCSFTILSGCGPKFLKHEWIIVKVIIDSEPTEAKVFNKNGERIGYTPYVYERKFAKQYWSDGDVAYYENEESYKIGSREEFIGIVLKEGYRKQLVEIPYKFEGKPLIVRKMVFLNQ